MITITSECNIDGVVIRHPEKHVDARGWLVELYRSDKAADGFEPVMSYVSMTSPGVVRGPHEHRQQTDYFCFFGSSEFRIYLWDNRPDSATYGRNCVIDAGRDEIICFIIPPGVVHAYKNIGDSEGLVYNAPDRLYGGHGKNEPPDEIRHEDRDDDRFIVS